MSEPKMRAQSVAAARALLADGDEAPTVITSAPETELLTALTELAEAAVGAASTYLYAAGATADPQVACYAQKVAVKASAEIARMQLWLQVPLSTGPDAD